VVARLLGHGALVRSALVWSKRARVIDSEYGPIRFHQGVVESFKR
jgi:hypothetical protein